MEKKKKKLEIEEENDIKASEDISLENDDNEELEEVTLEDRIINIEKKTNATLIIVVIIAILALINIFVLLNNNNSGQTTSDDNTGNDQVQENLEYDVSKFDEIEAKDLSSESKNKTIVVYIGRSSCGYCVQFIPVLKAVQETYKYTTKYIDIAKIIDYNTNTISDKDAYEKLTNMKTSDSQKDIMNQFGSTPMTLIIKNNKIVDSIVGAADENALATMVENNGFSKK